MAIHGSAFTGAPLALEPQKQSFGDKDLSGVKTAAETVSSLKNAV